MQIGQIVTIASLRIGEPWWMAGQSGQIYCIEENVDAYYVRFLSGTLGCYPLSAFIQEEES